MSRAAFSLTTLSPGGLLSLLVMLSITPDGLIRKFDGVSLTANVAELFARWKFE